MSKFLTPPVWYDENGNLVETLTGSVSYDPEVKFTNSMAIGKGSVVAGNSSVVIGETARSDGSDAVAIGYGSQTPSSGSIAIGSNTVAVSNPYDNNSIGSIAIGNNSQVFGDGSIVIGSGIGVGTEEGPINNTIQIGSFNKTYSAQIGDGNGTLRIGSIEGTPKIGSIAFDKMTIEDNKVAIVTSGVYLCCIIKRDAGLITSSVSICVIAGTTMPATVMSSSKDSCSYDRIAKKIQAGDGFTISYCFKIISL